MTNNKIEKIIDAHNAAIVYLLNDKHLKGAVKGSVPELLILMGEMIADIHEESGIELEDLGANLNEVVAKKIALREKEK